MARGDSAGTRTLPRAAGNLDWAQLEQQLHNAPPGDPTDDLIDAIAEGIFSGSGAETASRCLTVAVGLARSDLSRRSAALALAITASAGDVAAVDTLVSTFAQVADHPFLAPALLEALILLAVRDPLAYAQLSALLLRLNAGASPYLLVKAAKVIGRLDAMRPNPDLRAKLDELVVAEDPAVQAEARQQLALSALGDALLSEDQLMLRDRLTAARAAFARAEISEEHRLDAATFMHLLDTVLAFLALEWDHGAMDGVLAAAGTLERDIGSLATPDWHGYRSEQETLRALRVLHITGSLRQAAVAVGTADEWVNFSAVLEELARLHAQARGEIATVDEGSRLLAALGAIADRVFAASLGPLLARVVQQRRLSRITQDYVGAHGDDGVAAGLRALGRAAAAAAFSVDPAFDGRLAGQVAELAAHLGCSPEALLAKAIAALHEGNGAQWAELVGLTRRPLPFERPGLYGDDPAVDDVVRALLRQTSDVLGEYPSGAWARLSGMVVSLVRFAQYVRDVMPEYVVCEEDGGLGQRSSEDNLQEHLFEWLRQEFGTKATYEIPRMGGGRPDIALIFEEARFPVEVKHEFDSVTPDHIRTHFVLQPDAYATATDRVCFLMVLDLRDGNAAGHRDRRMSKGQRDARAVASGLYHLRDSFHVETPPTDPDIPGPTRKVVVVGLVPGNRPRPSSLSTYSRRPSSRSRRKSGTPTASGTNSP